ncbi:MAG: peptide chain release factor N(5)-glutamine methyltransferase [Gemmatimonadota bacterium]|nr:peptide chain release factor N(5)-glutamine methyltransferase [Gemmatimonadota bacterium]
MSEEVLLRDLILRGAGRLAAAGVAEPRREAVRLWADLAGLESYALPLPEPAVDPASADRFRAAVERRAGGEPLPYVTGVVGFRRLTLAADPRALIPRPETEGLVDLLLAHGAAGRVADVGTGSGCIALALADEGEYREVIGVERSRDALALAAENRGRTGLRVALVAGDLLSGFADRCLDAVISNPPYLTEAEYQALDPAVRGHEPAEALASGADGLRASEAVLTGAARVLVPGGVVALEIDAARPGESAALAAAAGLVDVTVHADLFGRARYLLARRSEMP